MKVLRSFLKRLSFDLFMLGDRLGVHLLPKHYHTPIPDYRWLRRHRTLWAGRASLTGVRWDLDEQLRWLRDLCAPYYHEVRGQDLDEQLRWLRDLCAPYYHEVRGLHVYRQLTASGVGAGYRPIESQVLHCFLRAMRPATVIEIGSGVSTACMLNAVRLNQQEGQRGSRLICIEPYPTKGFAPLEGITPLRA